MSKLFLLSIFLELCLQFCHIANKSTFVHNQFFIFQQKQFTHSFTKQQNMSLVAYTVDSGDESENEDETETAIEAIIIKNTAPEKIATEEEEKVSSHTGLTFDQLPAPKTQLKKVLAEEDDEFLHKSAAAKNGTTISKVQITIPSLREFKDVQTYKNQNRNDDVPLRRAAMAPKKTSKLLNILPQAKSEMNFIKTNAQQKPNNQESTNVPKVATTSLPTPKQSPTVLKSVKNSANRSLIPDSIRLGRKGCNTEDQIDRVLSVSKAAVKHKLSDESDDDDEADFFSLNADEKNMPEVSELTLNEVNALAQQHATKLAAKASGLQAAEETPDVEETNAFDSSTHSNELDAEALQTLVGRKAAKRARRGESNIQIMDLHSSEVLPSREEWMRSALASATEHQPKGVLTDEEPAAGTRRKHQITYLAHKAKANEAELQAMWAANRQTRRATQSKYGF